jgi:DNA-binding CsgD family transcriptional regulator
MSSPKTFICVRSELVAKGLMHYIHAIAPATAIDFFKTTPELLAKINSQSPQSPIIFLDLQILVGEPGIFLEKIKKIYSSCILVGISEHQINDRLLPYFDYLILVEELEEKIVKTLRLIYHPELYEYSRVENIQIISDRESDILKCVAQGLTNKEISEKLNISVHTVITHRKNITFKLGIKTIAGLTVYAILKNIISAEEVKT